MAEKGRPRAFDRDAALDAAILLFWRKGYTATSMADLTAAMGIGAPSLYAAFGNKEALYSQALARYAAQAQARLWAPMDAAPTARAAIEAMLLTSATALAEEGHPTGCMVTLCAASDEDWSDQLRDAARAARRAILDKLTSCLVQAMQTGELPATADVTRLARFYLCVHQGMSIQARDGATPEELQDVARAAMLGWDALSAV